MDKIGQTAQVVGSFHVLEIYSPSTRLIAGVSKSRFKNSATKILFDYLMLLNP
jgi:hypothetical protein